LQKSLVNYTKLIFALNPLMKRNGVLLKYFNRYCQLRYKNREFECTMPVTPGFIWGLIKNYIGEKGYEGI